MSLRDVWRYSRVEDDVENGLQPQAENGAGKVSADDAKSWKYSRIDSEPSPEQENGGAPENQDARNSVLPERKLSLVSPGDSEAKPCLRECDPVTLEWTNLQFSVKAGKEKRNILKGLSGKAAPRSLKAIMGPSAAGKSTLLNILAALYTKGVTGEIRINGRVRSTKFISKRSSYVMQDSNLLPDLTVHEALYMSTELRLPMNATRDTKEQTVDDIMMEWGITQCRNTRICNLSGGESRRLAIAQELVSNSPLIFLDEPTSGLDSLASYKCIETLRSLANRGHTILCTIHQPSAKLFELFDELYMLADGKCIYDGHVDSLVPFLSSFGLHCPTYHNPSDFIIEVASGLHGPYVDKLAQSFHKDNCIKENGEILPAVTVVSNEKDSLDDDSKYGFKTNSFNQFWVLMKRCFLCTFRNKVAVLFKLASYIGLGILVGILYFRIGNESNRVFNNAALVVFCLMFYFLTSLVPTVLIFSNESAVFVREYRNCWYSTKMYFLAKTLSDIPFQIFFPTLLCSIAYWMTGQPTDLWRFGITLYFSIMTSMVSQAIGLILSAALHVNTAVFIAPMVTGPFIVFSGFFIAKNYIPVYLRWFCYASYMYYAFTGTLMSIYGYDREELNCSEDEMCYFVDPNDFLIIMDVKDVNIWVNMGVIVVFDLVYRFIAYRILKSKVSR